MNKKVKPSENVCLTAYRVIAILLMLKESPHSEAEINEKLENNIELPRSLSKDSIWLYINTLKAIGCQITRPSKKNDYKYILKDHPFKLNLSQTELKTLLEARKYIAELSDWKISSSYDRFLLELSYILPEEDKSIIIKYCKNRQREIDYTLKKQLIVELELHISTNNCLLVTYNSPSGNISDISLITDSLKYENGALYLWGYNIESEEYQYLRVDRIDGIKEIKISDEKIIKPPLIVKYKLFGLYAISYKPDDDEEIIAQDEQSITVQVQMKNKFKLVQKIFSFGCNCEVLEPAEIQHEIIKRLKLMAKTYND